MKIAQKYQTPLRMAAGIVAVLLAAFTTACDNGDGDDDDPTGPGGSNAARVVVQPGQTEVKALGVVTQLSATVTDADGQVIPNAAVAWTTPDTLVARVDSEGRVTSVGNGRATIIATSGRASGTATYTVTQTVARVVINDTSVTLTAVGQTRRLAATARDANGNVMGSAPITWSVLNQNVVTVDQTGMVTAQGGGETLAAATSGGMTGTSRIVVLAPPVDNTVATVGISGANSAQAGSAAVQLSVACNNAAGSSVGCGTLTWASSNTAAATVDQSGRVTPVAAGSANITATSSNGRVGTHAFTVTGASAAFACGNAAVAGLACLIDGAFVVDPNLSTAQSVQVYEVSTGQNLLAGTFTRTSRGLEGALDTLRFPRGQERAVSFKDANFIPLNRYYRNGPQHFTGDTINGVSLKVRRNSAGALEIGAASTAAGTASVLISSATVPLQGLNWTCAMTVDGVSVTCPTITTGTDRRIELTVAAGGSRVISSVVSPPSGHHTSTVGGRSISADTVILKPGETRRVEVIFRPNTGTVATVQVTANRTTFPAEQSTTATCTPKDTSGNTVDVTCTWSSSNTAVASISGSGRSVTVVGVAPGTARITATVSGVNGFLDFTIETRLPVHTVTVSPATATANVGGTQQFTAALKDASGNTLTGRSVTWSSSATAVATINASGLATCASQGTATITGTSEGKSGTAQFACQTSGGTIPDTSWVQRWSDGSKTVMQINGWRLQRSGIFPTRESDLPATLCMTGPSLGGCAVVADKAANGVYNLPMSRLVGKLPEGQIYYHFTDGGDRWLFFPNRNEPGVCANVSGWTWVLGARWNNSGGVAKGEEFTCR